jgi:hypothetical protein
MSHAADQKQPQQTPFLCRTNLHHHWMLETNPDGETYLRCSRCGKDRYDVEPPDDPAAGGHLASMGGS